MNWFNKLICRWFGHQYEAKITSYEDLLDLNNNVTLITPKETKFVYTCIRCTDKIIISEDFPKEKKIKAWCPFCGSYCGVHDPNHPFRKQVHCSGCGRDLFT